MVLLDCNSPGVRSILSKSVGAFQSATPVWEPGERPLENEVVADKLCR
jgi:hypothetical protein